MCTPSTASPARPTTSPTTSALPAEDKVRRLDRMGAVLDGAPGDGMRPPPLAMRAKPAETGVTAQHCHDVLRAFARTRPSCATATGTISWSIAAIRPTPVGRHCSISTASPATPGPSSDPLCNALQVLNHLQDCVDDYRALDRVYLPERRSRRLRRGIEDLTKPQATPGLRQVHRPAARRHRRPHRHGARPAAVDRERRACAARRAVIVTLAEKLARRLRRGDPVARRVALTRRRFRDALPLGLWRGRRWGRG